MRRHEFGPDDFSGIDHWPNTVEYPLPVPLDHSKVEALMEAAAQLAEYKVLAHPGWEMNDGRQWVLVVAHGEHEPGKFQRLFALANAEEHAARSRREKRRLALEADSRKSTISSLRKTGI